jgi:hypothetical protein
VGPHLPQEFDPHPEPLVRFHGSNVDACQQR